MSNGKSGGLRGIGRVTTIVCVIALAAAASAIAAVRAHTSTTTVSTRHGKLGVMLAASNGHTLYLSTADKRDVSNCNSTCAKIWIPLTASGPLVAGKGSGVKQSLLGTIHGTHQVTYNGHPLYLFSSDKKAGQLNGEGAKRFSGTWYAVGTSGNALKPKQKSVCDPLCPGY
jgi:predicted lipoprotein with Yx(FWY)xxD motif